MVTKTIDVVANFTQKGLETFRKNIKGWNASMGAPLSRMKEIRTEQGDWNTNTAEGSTRMGRMALGLRNATHGMRGFRMEMLGVMFFGMSMQRTFGGLLKTSLEWTGIMELLSATLGILFLPIVLQLLEAFIPISSWLMNLSDSTKLWIGWIVVLGFAIGTILMIIGQLALGIGSLILAFGGFSLATMVSAFLSLGVLLLSIAGIFVVLKGALGGFNKDFDNSLVKWQQNGGMFAKTMGGIVRIFNLGGALMAATFQNAGSLILIAINQMAKGVNTAITFTINKLITAWNWIKKVAAMGGSYNKTALIESTSGVFDQRIAEQKKKIADRSVDLILNTPSLSDLFTGGPVIPETSNIQSTKTGSSSTETNITNNYNGFTMEELKKELDYRDSQMVAQIERNK